MSESGFEKVGEGVRSAMRSLMHVLKIGELLQPEISELRLVQQDRRQVNTPANPNTQRD